MAQKTLIWFQKDLRIHDNSLLEWIQMSHRPAVSTCFVPKNLSLQQRYFWGYTALEFQKKLQEKGLTLYIIEGEPDQIIPRLVEHYNIDVVLTGRPFNSRDSQVLRSIEKKVPEKEFIQISHSTLIHPEDLPFAISEMPQVFSKFRRLVEKSWKIRPQVDVSNLKISRLSEKLPQDILCFQEKDLLEIEMPYSMKPGEAAGLEHLSDYIWEQKAIATYKESRNGMIQKNDSSKLSPWLAIGSLSVRLVYEEVKKFENEFGRNESTEWFVQELLWRDYFKFLASKIQDRLFQVNGLENSFQNWRQDQKIFAQWKTGNTGSSFVDANMIELAQTGWMSNRGRQNVASFLAKTLNLDWTWGAQHFEQTLIDIDIESNWGNWLYLSGQGTDPRDRVFNVERQAEFYDPQGEYQNLWLSKRKGR